MVRYRKKATAFKPECASKSKIATDFGTVGSRRRLKRVASGMTDIAVKPHMCLFGGRSATPIALPLKDIKVQEDLEVGSLKISAFRCPWLAKVVIGTDMQVKKAETLKNVMDDVRDEIKEALRQKILERDPRMVASRRPAGMKALEMSSESESDDEDGREAQSVDASPHKVHLTHHAFEKVQWAGAPLTVKFKHKCFYVKANADDIKHLVGEVMERFNDGRGDKIKEAKRDDLVGVQAKKALRDIDDGRVRWLPHKSGYNVSYVSEGKVKSTTKGLKIPQKNLNGSAWTDETLEKFCLLVPSPLSTKSALPTYDGFLWPLGALVRQLSCIWDLL